MRGAGWENGFVLQKNNFQTFARSHRRTTHKLDRFPDLAAL
jgi:hypothetical protein